MKALQKRRKRLVSLLKKSPNDAKVLSEIASTYYSQKRYKMAYRFDRDALLLSPGNPTIVCNFACDLDMLYLHEEAIVCWKELLKWSIKKIARNNDQTLQDAAVFKNDCRFRISVSYFKAYNGTLAKVYLRNYMDIKSRNGLETRITKKSVFGHSRDVEKEG